MSIRIYPNDDAECLDLLKHAFDHARSLSQDIKIRLEEMAGDPAEFITSAGQFARVKSRTVGNTFHLVMNLQVPIVRQLQNRHWQKLLKRVLLFLSYFHC
jgi:hypothetical protein